MTLLGPDLRRPFNFRDLGGTRLRGGAQVAAGRLFRSAAVDCRDQDQRRLLERLGIRTVVDLRSNDERGRFGDAALRYDGIVRFAHLPLTIDLAPNAVGQLLDWQAKREAFVAYLHTGLRGERQPDPPHVRRKAMNWALSYLAEGNERALRALFTDNVPCIRASLELVAEQEEVPILFHCAAGKDRTGLIIAFILLALGANPDAIEADYAASNEHWARHVIQDFGKANGLSGPYDRELWPFFGVSDGIMGRLVEELVSQAGSRRQLLRNTIGLSDKTIAALQQYVVES